VGHAARRGYLRVVYGRYGKAEGQSKERMLDEFCLNTGYHRKYAIRLLNGAPAGEEGVRGAGTEAAVQCGGSEPAGQPDLGSGGVSVVDAA